MFSFLRISGRIKTNEGFRHYVYRDQLGNRSIGYGHLISTKENFSLRKLYSKKVLLKFFYIDLRNKIFNFKKNYDYEKLSDNTQEVIIEMIFQMGIKKVLKFKKFYYYIKKKQFYLASLEMIKSRWYQQTPKRADKLIAILLKHNV